MKTNKIGSYAFIAMAIVGTLLIAGCPTSGDDGGGGAVEFSGVLYEDGFTSSVTVPLYWNGDNGFTVDADTTEKKTGTTSFKVDWSAAEDWNGVAVNVGSGQAAAGTVDLSGFDALTFWAKASAANAEIDKFGFGADDEKINSIGNRYEVWLENQAVDTTWTKYIIPLPNPAKLTAQNSLFYAVDGKNGATIYLDDIKFEKLGTVAVSSLTYSGEAMNIQGTGTIAKADLSAEFTVDGTVIPNVMTSNLVAYVDWKSSDTSIATVDAVGLITRVSDGTATITGTLGTLPPVDIAVTTQAVATFTGVIYDDAVQGGFSINKDANGGAANVTIDSAFSVDSQTAIQVTLAAGTTIWGGFFFESSNGVDISGKDLKFSVLKTSLDTAPITALGVKLQDTQGAHHEIDLFNESFTKTANGNWYDFSIPVLAFNNNAFDATGFNILGFWNPKKDDSGSAVLATGEFVFDDIRFEASTATTYTVTYNANGGSGTLSKPRDTVTEGASVSEPTGITRAGYILTGWNTAANGSGDDFVFGTTQVIADITLYAQWATFTGVIYDDELHGGFAVDLLSDGDVAIISDSTDSVAGGTGNSIKISQTSGTWGGGFVQNDAGVDASGFNKIQFSINVSKLHGTVDYMQIKFEDAGGAAKSYNLYDLTASAINGAWKTYTFVTSMITGVDFTKFKHLGFWHPKAGGSEGAFKPGTFYVDDIKFDATPLTTYTVTYDDNGSDGGTLSKATDTVTAGLSLPTTVAEAPTGITKTGHTLSGWNTAANGSGDDFVFGTTLVTGAITLYAQWTAIP